MKYIIGLFLVGLTSYGLIGTSYSVDEIKQRSPQEIAARNWEIVRYEGYQFGSFRNDGGKVWYHVKDLGHSNTYYRVFVTLWGNELHFNYGQPEILNRLNIDNG